MRHNFNYLPVCMLHCMTGECAQVGNRLLDIMRHNPFITGYCRIIGAINTAFHADDALVDTFIAQLFDAPSQIIPLTSPIILLIAIAMVLKPPSTSHAIPAAAPIAAVVAAHNAESRGS